MKKKFVTGKKVMTLLLSAVMIFSMTACGSEAPAEAAVDEGSTEATKEAEAGTENVSGEAAAGEMADSITIVRTADAAYLDPNAESIGGAEVMVMQQIYEGLVKSSLDGQSIEPCLASDWTISEDGLTYTFHLVPDIKFSDGTPVTGEDWEWSLLRARDTETSAYAFIAEAIDTVEATDSQVVITLKQPWAPFLADLCNFNMVVGCKAYYDKVGAEGYNKAPLGTGPYMAAEWVKDDHITLEANPYYHEAGYPKTKQIVFSVVTDDNTRLMQLQAGQADIVSEVPLSMAPVAEKDENLNFQMFDSTQQRYFILNTTKAPFDDIKVRQAFEYAVNKEELAQVIAGEYGKPAASIVSDTQGKWCDTDLQSAAYDPEKAKEMLADAGYSDGIDFTLTIRSGSDIYEQMATLIQSEAKEAGFNITIEKLESAAVSEKYENLEHQATILMWIDDIVDPSGVCGWTVDYDQCNGWYTGLNDTALDDLNTQACSELDETKRIEMYHDIQQKVHENANVLPLFSNGFAYASGKNIEGLYVSPFSVLDCKELVKTK